MLQSHLYLRGEEVVLMILTWKPHLEGSLSYRGVRICTSAEPADSIVADPSTPWPASGNLWYTQITTIYTKGLVERHVIVVSEDGQGWFRSSKSQPRYMVTGYYIGS